MGLIFNEHPAGAKERAVVVEGADETAGERSIFETVGAEARRIKDEACRIKAELTAVNDRMERLYLDLDSALNRIVDDPSYASAASDLESFLRDGEEIVEKLRALSRAFVAVETDLAELVSEERLAAGYRRARVPYAMENLLWGVENALDELRLLTDVVRRRTRAAAGTTDDDAPTAGDLLG